MAEIVLQSIHTPNSVDLWNARTCSSECKVCKKENRGCLSELYSICGGVSTLFASHVLETDGVRGPMLHSSSQLVTTCRVHVPQT